MIKKRFIPTYRAESIYSLDLAVLEKQGIKVILSDLDNTLDSYRSLDPSPRAFLLKKEIEAHGMTLYLVSNNTSKRVRRYAKELGVVAFYGLLKPFAHKLKKLMAKQGFKPAESVLIGDQILTDVVAANGAGLHSILTEPISELDPWMTRLNRHFENKIKRKLTVAFLAKKGKELPS
jgi:HAD superfamily phosphatase (TIGR01668 family)